MFWAAVDRTTEYYMKLNIHLERSENYLPSVARTGHILTRGRPDINVPAAFPVLLWEGFTDPAAALAAKGHNNFPL